MLSCRLEFLSFYQIDVLCWLFLCGEAYCRRFSCLPGLDPLDASSLLCLHLWLVTVQCSLGGKNTPPPPHPCRQSLAYFIPSLTRVLGLLIEIDKIPGKKFRPRFIQGPYCNRGRGREVKTSNRFPCCLHACLLRGTSWFLIWGEGRSISGVQLDQSLR